MKATQILNLISLGAEMEARQRLKRLALEERLPKLWELVPFVRSSPRTLSFFQKHFAVELGALTVAKGDLVEAKRLYERAKGK